MSKEAVITGFGMITPAGMGKDACWRGMVSGQSFITPITSFDPGRFACKVAGQVPDFQALAHLDSRVVAQTDRWSHFDLVCAMQALADAQLSIRDEDPTRVGAVYAAGTGGNGVGQEQMHICSEKGPDFVSVYLSIAWFYAASLGQVSIRNGIRGYGRNICAEAAGGLIALAHAARVIAHDLCDVVMVGGCEAPLVPYTFAAHQASGLLSSSSQPYPYRPFDATRSGPVVGEGGACFCVESREHAQKRNAPIYAEITGWGQTFDGIVTREPATDGVEYARAMTLALQRAQLQPADIDWILCDGLGTPAGDRSEVIALKQVFQDDLTRIPASAPKSMIGRLFNGASTVDVALALLGFEHQTVLPTVGYHYPDTECQLDCVPDGARAHPLKHILIGARGFGGFNSALVLRRNN